MFNLLMALNVVDEETYQAYRDGMTPILTEMGGSFSYDFRIDETLKSAADHAVNRVFVISFPDQATSDVFFADPTYKEIRARFFDASVGGMTEIARF